jgi:hypothetical protein
MANALLDFVLSLVRDPDAAARYAENPQQAIADAHLTDVTSVDVNNLIPVVSESLSMAAPAFSADLTDANVWASGAATAAFDAFSDPILGPAVVDARELVFDQPDVTPLDTSVDQFDNPLPDAHAFDAAALDQPIAALESHDGTPAADQMSVDPGFEHQAPDHHGLAHGDTPLF